MDPLRKHRSRSSWLASASKLLLGAAALMLTLGAATYVAYDARTPDIEPLLDRNPTNTSFMRWRSGHVSSDLFGDPFDIAWLDIDSISPILACSVIKSEDNTFFEHDGLLWAKMPKAAVRNLLGGFGGGSTISQQLAKNLFLSADVDVGRKFRRRSSRCTWNERCRRGASGSARARHGLEPAAFSIEQQARAQ